MSLLDVRNYSLSRKLTLMNMAVSATALLLACASFVTYDVVTFRRNIVAYASSQATLIGSSSVSALVFNDHAAAQRTLVSLSDAPNINFAGLYTADGQVFATYSRQSNRSAMSLPSLAPGADQSVRFDQGEIALVQRIVFEGKAVGFSYVRVSSQNLYDRVRLNISVAAGVLVLSLVAALLLSSAFKRSVAEPIVHLAEVAQTVSREKRFSVRATPASGGSEVAVLINAFNDMLAQIQERDLALQQAHDNLEARVKERTAELQRKEERLRSLSGQLLKLQDEERRRIARELHDSTGQVLAAFAMNLAILQGEASKLSFAGVKAMNESLEMVKEISRELRTMSHLLHPPLLDEAGLQSALNWYVQGFAERSGIRAVLELPPKLGRLPRDLETAIFRIVQESLTNVHRHSGSAVAWVRVLPDERMIRVEVRDEGKGVSGGNGEKQVRPGVGIQGMRERVIQLGGQFEIQSDATGTLVLAIFPLTDSTSGSEAGIRLPAEFV